MGNDRGQILLLQAHHSLALLPFLLLFVFLLSFEKQCLGVLLVRQSVLVVVEQLLGLLDHQLEEGVGGHLEVSLHRIDVVVGEHQALCVRHTLHCEETLVQSLYAVTVELEGIILVVGVMNLRRGINDRILNAKVLHDALSPRLLHV